MITTASYQEVEMNEKDLSPQQSILTHSYDEEEFDIPQTALTDQKLGQGSHHQQQPDLELQQQHHHHNSMPNHQANNAQLMYGYEPAYYSQQQQQQQWDYGYYQGYHNHHQEQYHHMGYAQQQQYGMQQHPGSAYREDLYHSQPMGTSTPLPSLGQRSPSGSHSTPSPHSQSETPELTDLHPLDQQQQLKRSHLEAFRSEHVISGSGQSMLAAAAAKKPKVSRRKKKRDPNEPQKPVSAYALFFRDSQAAIKARNPNLSFGDVSKMVASMWDSLDSESKALYKKRTEMAKKEYLRQLASYRASLVSKGGGDEMYGYAAAVAAANGGYSGYGSSGGGGSGSGVGHSPMGLGQSIPPHPPGPYMTNSPDYLLHQVGNPGNGGDHLLRPTGSQQQHSGVGMSLPVSSSCPSSADSGGNGPASPYSANSDSASGGFGLDAGTAAAGGGFANGNNSFAAYDSAVGYPVHQHHDRNHNHQVVGGKCGRPGCPNPVNKAADGTESTYCSSECVVGQCREVYTSWATGSGGGNNGEAILHNNNQQQLLTQHQPSQVK